LRICKTFWSGDLHEFPLQHILTGTLSVQGCGNGFYSKCQKCCPIAQRFFLAL
jgi:hypothetical protein